MIYSLRDTIGKNDNKMDENHPQYPLKGIDIQKEYRFIQNKKSNLSCKMRSLVVQKYQVQTQGE